MNDESVRLGWKILKAIPKDDSHRSYEAVLAVHSLVWKVWQLENEAQEDDPDLSFYPMGGSFQEDDEANGDA